MNGELALSGQSPAILKENRNPARKNLWLKKFAV
jgi:hypothetical protein